MAKTTKQWLKEIKDNSSNNWKKITQFPFIPNKNQDFKIIINDIENKLTVLYRDIYYNENDKEMFSMVNFLSLNRKIGLNLETGKELTPDINTEIYYK